MHCVCDKVRKRRTKFMTTIALPKKFSKKDYDTKVWRSSGESNKMRYAYSIWGTPGDIAIHKEKNWL